jgi:RHS repeat-associated protein
MDAEGHVTQETYGNGVVTERGYQADTGRLQNITGYLGASQIQGHAYVYDTIGNVTIVADGPASQLEIRGGYDGLNRLTQVETYLDGGASTENIAYNALGNITSKTGVGTYAYGDPLHKHAVTAVTGGPVNNSYTYDANGNLTSGAGRSIAWTAWNMPASITSDRQTQSWLYDPEHSRYKLTAAGRTTWYLNPSVHTGGHYERTQYTSGTVEHRHTLYGGGKAIGEVLTFDGGAPSQTRYFHSDQQGSITAVTNEAGAVITRFRYDPWGKQTLVLGSNTGIDQTRQGHTTHEMLDSGLTHMNGRLYDPVLARFASADPYIQLPYDLQSFNRYAYVFNNPMGNTDPTGYFSFGRLLGRAMKAFDIGFALQGDIGSYKALTGRYGYQIKSVGIGAASLFCSGGAAACNAAGQALLAKAYGASTSDALRAGAAGFVTAVAYNVAGKIGQSNGAYGYAHFAAHAAAGCISAAAGGGNCGTGALSGVAGLAGTPYGMIGAMVAGGTASVLGGGKFANGAATGAFGYLFNHWAHNLALALDGIEAHQALQGYQANYGLFTEKSCISPYSCVDGRFDIAAADGQLWEIKRNSLAGRALGAIALDAYTEPGKSNFYRGGDLPGLPVGGSITLGGGSGGTYSYQNLGGGLVVYDKLPGGSTSTSYQHLPRNYFSSGRTGPIPIPPVMLPIP